MHQLKATGRVDMPGSAAREERWLPGQAPLRKYSGCVRKRCIESPDLDRLSRTALPAAMAPLFRCYLPPDRARAPVPVRAAGAKRHAFRRSPYPVKPCAPLFAAASSSAGYSAALLLP